MFRRGKLSFVTAKDDRIKVFNERINLTEKYALEIATLFSDCARKTAKHRDAFDELAKGLKNYADDEEICESLSEGMKSFTNAITILGDYMDINVHRLEMKVVNELAQFESLCKNTRDSLRTAVVARDKEVLKQRQVMEIKTKFSANNSAADSELLKSKLEVNRTNKEIDEIFDSFEKRKLSELKATLTDFILISLKYHSKALEVLSSSYYDVCNIDDKGDFMEFQKVMKTNVDPEQNKKGLKKSQRSKSMEQLSSTLKRSTRLSRSTKNLSAKSEDELDADDNDDDDDDDDVEEEASDDNSNGNESSSATEEEGDEESESESDSKNINKKHTQQHFKVQHNPPKKPFAVLRGTGIPKFQANHKKSESSKSEAPGTSGPGRLVTIVESKKKPREGD